MDALVVAHLVSLGFWGGVVLTEAVLELAYRDDDSLRFTARVHYWIDLIIELPVIGSVLVTGILLSIRDWPLSDAYLIKIGAALVAIGINLYCVAQVVLRFRATTATEVRAYSRRVQLAGLGVPFALVAAYIGFASFTP